MKYDQELTYSILNGLILNDFNLSGLE